MPYDFERLGESARSKTHETCAACDAVDWAFPQEIVVLQHVLLPHYDTDDRAVRRVIGIPTLPIICRVCGFVRLHAVAYLDPDDHVLEDDAPASG